MLDMYLLLLYIYVYAPPGADIYRAFGSVLKQNGTCYNSPKIMDAARRRGAACYTTARMQIRYNHVPWCRAAWQIRWSRRSVISRDAARRGRIKSVPRLLVKLYRHSAQEYPPRSGAYRERRLLHNGELSSINSTAIMVSGPYPRAISLSSVKGELSSSPSLSPIAPHPLPSSPPERTLSRLKKKN